MKTARRQAREIAVQALYAWQLSGGEPLEQVEAVEELGSKELEFLKGILGGVVSSAAELETRIKPHLSRDFARLSPVERAILLIGAWELVHNPEIPYKVTINEAIELGKRFGGTDGHKYVNGVLDKLAAAVRPEEVAQKRSENRNGRKR
jgi:N utilization substance protein B